MSKLFTARMPDGSERFAASLSMGRAEAFFDQAKLLEKYVDAPLGIAPDASEDEHWIDPLVFERFFNLVWETDWLADKQSGLFHPWAQLAAGMLENIFLKPHTWIDRDGEQLIPFETCGWMKFPPCLLMGSESKTDIPRSCCRKPQGLEPFDVEYSIAVREFHSVERNQ